MPKRWIKRQTIIELGESDDRELVFACLNVRSSLVIAEINVNNELHNAIIDSGASASLMTESLASKWQDSIVREPAHVTVRTANHGNMIIQQKAEVPVRLAISKEPKLIKFLITNEHTTILGHQFILGVDAICKLGIHLTPTNQGLMALVDGIQISKQQETICGIKSEQDPMSRLLADYDDIFEEAITSMMKVTPMEIRLNSDRTVKAKLRSYCQADILEIGKQLKRLEENDIIEPSNSEYSSSCHLVPKKNGQRRLVINFIPINNLTIKDLYPLPLITDLINALRGANYYTALDCTEGFFQIPIKDTDRHKTAFITHQGLFHFKRCPFGFTNSPAAYQRAMNSIFKDGLYSKVVIYIDDILIFGTTLEELISHTKWVFQKCRQFSVKLKKSKCQFAQKEVAFLGYQITPNRIGPIKQKCRAAFETPPTDIKSVQSILGVLNFYRRFIPDYTTRVKPIRQLTKKQNQFVWTQCEQKILDDIETDLEIATPDIIPDPNSPKVILFKTLPQTIEIICTDLEGSPINRAGHTLGDSEVNYSQAEKTMMAIRLAYKNFFSILNDRVIFRGQVAQLKKALSLTSIPERIDRLLLDLPQNAKFELEQTEEELTTDDLLISKNPPDEIFYTDGACTGNGTHKCVASWAILAINEPKLSASGIVTESRPSSQTAELTAILKALEVAVKANLKRITIITDSKYAKGVVTNKWTAKWQADNWKTKRNKPVINAELVKKLLALVDQLQIECHHVKGHSGDANNEKVDRMAKAALQIDDENKPKVATLRINEWNKEPDIIEQKQKLLDNPDKDYVVHNEHLYYIDVRLPEHMRYRLVVPKTQRQILLRLAHDNPISGDHLGVTKTSLKLIEYYWPDMRKSIEHHILSCDKCQRNKRTFRQKIGLLQPIPVSHLFERLHLDIVGPITGTRSSNRYIITCIDALSRYAYATAMPNVTTREVIKFLMDEIISKHGLPAQITTDNGTQFVSQQFVDFLTRFKIKHSRTCDNHPQANGMNERFNGTISKWLKNYTIERESDWDVILPFGLLAYNCTIHQSTFVSPYSVLYGRKPRLDIPAINDPDIPPQHKMMRKLAAKNSFDSQLRQKSWFDLDKRPAKIKPFDFIYTYHHGGDRTLSKKLKPMWTGPHIVTKIKYEAERPIALEILDLEKLQTRRVAFNDAKEAYLPDYKNDHAALPGELLVKYIITSEVPADYDPLLEFDAYFS